VWVEDKTSDSSTTQDVKPGEATETKERELYWSKKFYIPVTPYYPTPTGMKWSRKILDSERPRTWGEIACWGNQTLDDIMRREYNDQIVFIGLRKVSVQQLRGLSQIHVYKKLYSRRKTLQ
jgi:hypothetical protein